MRKIFVAISMMFASVTYAGGGAGVHLDKAPGDLRDTASLQRGAAVYMNQCMGCHSLEYMRYNRVAKDLKLVDADGAVNEALVKKYLNLVTEKSTDMMLNSVDKKDAADWFGVAPPDLTLVARVRGNDWLYTYLRTFYQDDARPWGVNNLVFKDVGMPHVLNSLQGLQQPVFKTVEHLQTDGTVSTEQTVIGVQPGEPGTLSPQEYDLLVADLVNFLDYAAEPMKLDRYHMGVWAILFLVIFTVFAYLLKREYWKDVH